MLDKKKNKQKLLFFKSCTWLEIRKMNSLVVIRLGSGFVLPECVSSYMNLDKFLSLPKCQFVCLFNHLGFPGGPLVKNLPADAGDMGLTPGLGRFHMLWGS